MGCLQKLWIYNSVIGTCFYDDNEVTTKVASWYFRKSAGFDEDSIKGLFHISKKCAEISQ